MRSNLKRLVVLQVALVFMFTTGCVKQRADIDAQGANLSQLIAVDDIKSWKDTISTHDSKGNAAISEADLLEANTSIEADGIKFPKIVTFSTTSKLLNQNIAAIDLFGEANTTYPVVYKLTPNFLKIYKQVSKAQLSHYEIPYAEKQGSDFIVPIGGYNASYYNVDKVKNSSNNRDTNITSKFYVPSDKYLTAAYIEVDYSKFTPFQRVEKLDVLPADYFTKGEWYYASSIISTKPGEEQKIGYVDGSVDASLRKLATKIKFTKINSYLRGINVVKDKRVTLNEDQADDVINIRVDWEEYRTTPFGDGTGLSEEKYDYVTEVQRTYGRFHFPQTVTITGGQSQEAQYLEGVFKGIKLTNLKIRPDSFSYTLIKTSTGEQIKYSFLRVTDRNYTERTYFKNDRLKFGFFATDKFKLSDYQDHREGDVEKNVVITRYNPKKDVYFRFSSLTPKYEDVLKDPNKLKIDFRSIGRKVVNQWNRAFQLAGSQQKLQVLADDAELGDLDVNVINIVDNIGGSGLLGVGPTVTDPETGEVISGTVNVYVGPLITSAADDIRDYIKIKTGVAKDVGFSKAVLNNRPLFNYISMEVEHFCPEVKSYANQQLSKAQQEKRSKDSTQENVVVNSCLTKLLPKRIASVISHEMGHSPFGLRHNFFGSSDKANSFYTMERLEQVYPRDQFPEIYEYYPNEKFLPAGSSIMDYSPYSAPYLVMPGTYDVAAIAYGYTNQVEVNKTRSAKKPALGSWEKIDTTLALEDQDVYAQSNSFKYCTDEQVDRTIIDPLCKRHDFGYTPDEALDFDFNQYRDFLVLYGQKLDRDAVYNYSGYRLNFLNHMAEIYGAWRSYVHDYVGEQRTYLDFLNKNSARAFQEELQNSATFTHKEYIGVPEKYFNLVSEVLFLPDLYCVAISENKSVKLMEFEKLQKQVIGGMNVSSVKGCEDPNLKEYVKNQQGLDVVTSIGLPVNNVQFSLSIEDAAENYDVFGLEKERTVAGQFLTGRVPPGMSYLLLSRKLQPSAMDEPLLYEKLRTKVTERLLKGLDVRASLAENLAQLDINIPAEELPVFQKYDSEWAIYQETLAGLINSSIVPGKPQRSVIQDFLIGKTNTATNIDPGSNVYMFNGNYFFARPEAVFINAVFDKLNQNDQPLLTTIKGATAEQQALFKSYLGAVKVLPVNGGKVGFDALSKLFSEYAKIQQSATTPTATTLFTNGTKKLSSLLDGISIRFQVAQSGQVPAGVTNEVSTLTVDEAKSFIQELQSTDDVNVVLEKYLKADIKIDQKTLVGLFVQAISQDAYTEWQKSTESALTNLSQLDEDELLDVSIQTENLRKLLLIMPGANK